MRSNDKISIVIPVYNEKQFIGQAIDAILKADTKYLQKEIIVVDDGSNAADAVIV